MIQGYVGMYDITIGKKNFKVVLISRRSCQRYGTRYNHRGLDSNGNVANFNESE